MPYVRVGNDEFTIDWDPDFVSYLIFRGYDVLPDDDIDPSTLALHNQQLKSRLRKLWGNTKLRSADPQGTTGAAPRIPAITEGKDPLLAPFKSSIGRAIMPNPYVDYQSQAIPKEDMSRLQYLLNFQKNWKKPEDI